jgi:broad specificity phosphatase PhoE
VSDTLPIVYLVRHGESEWTITGQHRGLTELPLTARGECNAGSLKGRLCGLSFARVFTSPLQRVIRTCELTGLAYLAEIDPDPVEWGYGEYAGRRTVDTYKVHPDWQLFNDGWRGITKRRRHAGRSCHPARAGDRQQCASFPQRAFPPSMRGALVGLRGRDGQSC